MQQRVVDDARAATRAGRLSVHLAFGEPQRVKHGLTLGRAGHLPAGPGDDPPPRGRLSTAGRPGTAQRVVVGIGELAVSDRRDDVIVTYALGSCVAVCLFDPVATVAAMLHFLLPESSINPEARARAAGGVRRHRHSAAVRDGRTIRPAQDRASVRLVGGAEIASTRRGCATGRRNILAARTILWRKGAFIEAQEVGGGAARTVHLSVGDGRLRVFNGREQIKEM